MATKTNMKTFITEHTGENENWGDLDVMNYSEVKKIYDYLVKAEQIKVNEDSTEEVVEDVVEAKPVKINPKVAQEYVTITKKPDHLSMAEKRAYARTGVLPKIKVNKYDRFDKDKVKFGF